MSADKYHNDVLCFMIKDYSNIFALLFWKLIKMSNTWYKINLALQSIPV